RRRKQQNVSSELSGSTDNSPYKGGAEYAEKLEKENPDWNRNSGRRVCAVDSSGSHKCFCGTGCHGRDHRARRMEAGRRPMVLLSGRRNAEELLGKRRDQLVYSEQGRKHESG